MARYNGIKLVVCDLDGTLLDPDGNIGDDSIEALNRLNDAGIQFAIATGRPFYDIDSKLRECEAIRFFITSNGANVVDRFGEFNRNTLLDGNIINRIYTIISPYKMTVSIHKDGNSLVDAKKITPEGFEEYGTSKYYQKYYTTLSIASSNFQGLVAKMNAAEMMSVYFKYETDSLKCLAEIKQIEGINVTSSSKGNIEIISMGVSKGAALSRLMTSIGLSASSVAVVGDSKNDISMFKVAGLPLAMSNACDELKAFAKDVICSNADNTAVFLSHSFI